MKSRSSMMVALVAALLAAGAFAHDGPGKGMGAGMHAAGASAPMMGPGGQAGRHGGRTGADVTPGWSMMTPAERNEHRDHMRSVKTHDECKAEMAKHHEQMAARAKDKGVKIPAEPRHDACAGMKH